MFIRTFFDRPSEYIANIPFKVVANWVTRLRAKTGDHCVAFIKNAEDQITGNRELGKLDSGTAESIREQRIAVQQSFYDNFTL